jgi:hypothetical protein
VTEGSTRTSTELGSAQVLRFAQDDNGCRVHCEAPCDHSSPDLLRLCVEVIVHHDEIEIAAVTQVLDVRAKGPLA